MSEIDPHALFAADWLSLREPADHAARSSALTAAATRWLSARDQAGPLKLVDLGSGGGSNLGYLAPLLPGRQCWHLVDHDAGLLERARQTRSGLHDNAGQPIEIITHVADLRHEGGLHLAGADLVTAAALFDLVDAGWIEKLAVDCAAAASAVLFVLSVDGRIRFSPEDADDAFVLDLLACHQRRDKGFGGALGTDAPDVMLRILEDQGFVVTRQPSDWQLDERHAELGRALIDGWRTAAGEQQPTAAPRIDAWAARRIRDLAVGRCTLVVGHQDVFATPPPSSASA